MAKKYYRVFLDSIMLIAAIDLGMSNYFYYSNKSGIHGQMESWFNMSKPLYSVVIFTGFIFAISRVLIGIKDYREKLNNQNDIILKTVLFIGIIFIELILFAKSGKG